jgi:glucosamine--fructose-6-phosphate aminotransferase (isomerizing)
VPENLAVVEGEYLRDILRQPQALENTLANLRTSRPLGDIATRLNKGRFQRVVLTGMGSSFHALHPLNLELISHGFTAIMMETSELLHYGKRLLGPMTLAIAVSQSGRSAETVGLMKTNRRRCPVIAVTNTPDSPLAKHADAAVVTGAGREFSVSCKTYVATLMALKWLGDALCERNLQRTYRELSHASPAVVSYLADWKDHVRVLAQTLRGSRHLFLAGRGASLATVGTGALIVKESDHFPAEGMSSAAFRHGPFEMLGSGSCVVVFAGDPQTRNLNERLTRDIRQRGGRAELVGQNAPLPWCRVAGHGPGVRQILEILPVQMITLALAAIAEREPGRFEIASKVTTAE